jgi:hypothetical protein
MRLLFWSVRLSDLLGLRFVSFRILSPPSDHQLFTGERPLRLFLLYYVLYGIDLDIDLCPVLYGYDSGAPFNLCLRPPQNQALHMTASYSTLKNPKSRALQTTYSTIQYYCAMYNPGKGESTPKLQYSRKQSRCGCINLIDHTVLFLLCRALLVIPSRAFPLYSR